MQVQVLSSPEAFHVCLQDKTQDLLTTAISGCQSLFFFFFFLPFDCLGLFLVDPLVSFKNSFSAWYD